MSMSILKRLGAAVPRSRERAELADAIVDASQAAARRNAALAHEESAIEVARMAGYAVSLAEDEVKEKGTQKARDALAQAHREHEAAVEKRDELNRGRVTLDRALMSADGALGRAVDGVLKSELPEYAASAAKRVLRLQKEMAASGEELKWLVEARMFPQEPGYRGNEAHPAEDIRRALWRIDPFMHVGFDDLIPSPPPSHAWKDVVAALRTDAATPLPTKEGS
jgi:hypothetical protein